MFKYIIILAAGAWFLYSLFYKTHWIAVLLFTCVIADINFDLPGSPLNFRSLVAFLLFVKVITDQTKVPGPSFISTPYAKYAFIFVAYALGITYLNDLLNAGIVKEYLFALLCAYLGYYYYMKEGSYKVFRLSIIIAGFSCLGDLAWTYVQGGGLWIQRIYFSFTPAFAIFNHNFFGYICSLAFVFLLADYLTDNANNKSNLLLMPCMFMGVLLSTSRSSLLILIIISVVLIAKGMASKKNGKKAYKLVMVTISCLVLTLFLFQMLTSVFHVSSEFLEQITARLIDEPVAVINRAMGNSFKAESLDSMDWRAEASQIAYDTYVGKLEASEQMFGIGHEGFLARNYGYEGVYDAHNGVLLMLIEFGVVGSAIYLFMLLGFFTKFWSLKLFSPLLVCMIFIIMYITSHNREIISFFVFLIGGTMAAQLKYYYLDETEVATDELPEIPNEFQQT
ncbi:MAG: O-antigen ligase family protein [Bacteroidota bacterium]